MGIVGVMGMENQTQYTPSPLPQHYGAAISLRARSAAISHMACVSLSVSADDDVCKVHRGP